MATVYLYSVALERPAINDYGEGAYRAMLASQREDQFGTHTLTDDPAAADLIIFVEISESGPHAINVRRHPLLGRFREKCFLVDPFDLVIPFLPGIYASIEKRWYSPSRTRSGPYPANMESPWLTYDPALGERDYLASFMGDPSTSRLRGQLATLQHPRFFFEDRSADSLRIRMTGNAGERAAFGQHYADVVRRSQFILCPRGLGPSSIRLFETLRMGRVPVIIADEWVEPPGPDWSTFSLRIAESDWATIPQLLAARESEAAAMGRLARAAWEEWFAPPMLFHRTVEQCLEMQRMRRVPEWIASLAVWPQLLWRAEHRRLWARRLKHEWLRR